MNSLSEYTVTPQDEPARRFSRLNALHNYLARRGVSAGAYLQGKTKLHATGEAAFLAVRVVDKREFSRLYPVTWNRVYTLTEKQYRLLVNLWYELVSCDPHPAFACTSPVTHALPTPMRPLLVGEYLTVDKRAGTWGAYLPLYLTPKGQQILEAWQKKGESSRNTLVSL